MFALIFATILPILASPCNSISADAHNVNVARDTFKSDYFNNKLDDDLKACADPRYNNMAAAYLSFGVLDVLLKNTDKNTRKQTLETVTQEFEKCASDFKGTEDGEECAFNARSLISLEYDD
jgi:fructose-1,6-bisphosphatase